MQKKVKMTMRKSKVINRPTKSKIVSLETILNRIYNTHDLRTTCSRGLTCCKTAMPGMYFSEFTSLDEQIRKTASKKQKLDMILKSVGYFFHNEFEKFGMDTLVKPCMLLSEDGNCKYYNQRPLNCRMYGLWPKEVYNRRVDKFEKAYEGLLKREELPLNTQCPNVKRVDDSKPLTEEIIEEIYAQLDALDAKTGNFTKSQIENKSNYRTFHDWLLFKVFGEEWLVNLTSFMKAASFLTINAQVDVLKQVITEKFSKDIPNW